MYVLKCAATLSAIFSCVKKLKTHSNVLLFVQIVVPLWREKYNPPISTVYSASFLLVMYLISALIFCVLYWKNECFR